VKPFSKTAYRGLAPSMAKRKIKSKVDV